MNLKKTLLKTLSHLLTTFILLGVSHATHCVSYFSYRSQGTNAVREMVGIEEYINLCGQDNYYGIASLAAEYTQTFDANKLSTGLFGADATCLNRCQSAITLSGSRATGRGAHDWLADYFGLPTDFSSTIALAPQIKNWLADFTIYVGLDKVAQGLYVRVNMPIVTTRWNLHQQERINNPGVNGYDYGYVSENFIFRGQLLNNALNFLSGAQAPYLLVPNNDNGVNAAYANIGLVDDLTTIYLSDVVFEPLIASKWAPSACGYNNGLSKTAVADFEMVLGYNALCRERGFLGFNARAVAPTGTKPSGQYFFEPVAGNGGHWELGVGMSAYCALWKSSKNQCTLDLYCDANITHLFNAHQKRSFDLICNGLNSRYMLAQKMTSTVTNDLGGTVHEADSDAADFIAATYQFDNVIAPVANITWSKINVNIAVEGDVALKFAFANGKGFGLDFGYNFWGRSHEKICRKGPACSASDPLNGTSWALKGDAMLFGYNDFNGGTETLAVTLSATESKASIHQGTNKFVAGLDSFEEYWIDGTNINDFGVNNGGVDNPLFAVAQVGTESPATTGWLDYIKTSIQPILLNSCDLDIRGMRSISNKLFTHLNYTWLETEHRWAPFLGAGASVEFGSTRCQSSECLENCSSSFSCSDTSSSSCGNSCISSSSNQCSISSGSSCCSGKNPSVAASQWAAWIKGGLVF